MEPVYFESPAAFRAWLAANNASETEIWMGYWKKGSGRAGLAYRQALEEALCFGWIDGQARSIDEHAYAQRWTPRTKTSTWSAINIRLMEELVAEGRAAPAGIAAFEARRAGRSAIYSHEQGGVAFSPAQEAALRTDAGAWAFWERQPASYRKSAIWWVVSAKQDATRARRLERLLAECRDGRRLAQFVSPGRRPVP